MSELIPAQVSPPGKLIQKELDARGWTVKDLAEKMGRSEFVVRQIIGGFHTLGITARTASELGEAFGTSAELWARMDADYRVWKERQK